jgi:hypothetical protein
VFSDTLLFYERAYLVRLLFWAATSVLAGTAIVGLLAIRRDSSPLLKHFAIQTALWGAVELVVATLWWRSLALRDLSGATRLDRLLWLNVGLAVGYAGIGVTLAIAGWMLGRRLGPVGAGTALLVQGLAMAAFELMLVLRVEPYV